MSLFKVRDLWASSSGKDETHEYSSLAIADLNDQGYDHIIVGSHNGYLRVFNPFSDTDIDETTGFKPTDLLIEIQLPQPILQVSVGKLVSGSRNNHIGILHPRSVAVYSLLTLAGSAEHGDQSQLFLAYEHHLKRSAYNLVVGGFGGVEGRDFMCAQGLDGTLMFFEQETLALARNLNSFLLPSPFIYIPHTDSFIILNANWVLESYRYQVLGEESSKKIMPSWTYNLGESILDILYVFITTNQAAIVVVAERNFYCFKENGVVQFCKRLQYTPVCSTAYTTGQTTNVMCMIISDTNDLMVYEQTTLRWSAQLHMTPVAIGRANLRKVSGSLVLLSEEGLIECCYLGTEPTIFIAPPLQGNAATMSEMESKLANLQTEIAGYMQGNRNPLEISSGTRPEVKLSVKAWPMQADDTACKVEILVSTMTPVCNLHITLDLHSPLVATPNSHHIQNIADNTEFCSIVSVEDCNTVIWDMELKVVGIYLTTESSINVAKASIILPIQLALDLSPISKDSAVKLTLTTTQPVILPTLFSEFPADAWNKTGSSETLAGFCYRHNPEVGFSIALSKSSSKYRLETENLISLALPVSIMARKLVAKKLETSQHTVAIKALLDEGENNVNIRNLIRKLQEELKEATSQSRAIQRRLLTKLRDKTPSNITPLHRLISETHDEIMTIGHKLEKAQEDLVWSGCRLGNFLKLTMELFKLNPSTDKREVADLTEALSYTQHTAENQGWAEVCEIAVGHLMRTSLARSVRDQQKVRRAGALVTQAGNFRELLSSALERVGRPHYSDDRVSPILESEEDGPRRKESFRSESSKVSGSADGATGEQVFEW